MMPNWRVCFMDQAFLTVFASLCPFEIAGKWPFSEYSEEMSAVVNDSRTSRSRCRVEWSFITPGLILCGAAVAQWTPIRLAQDGDGFSQVNAVHGGRQGGYRDAVVGLGGPGTWRGSAESWETLSDGRNGSVNSRWGGLQGGWYQPPGGGIWASLWSGTAQSRVSLHPSAYERSNVLGMFGSEQVGGVSRAG